MLEISTEVVEASRFFACVHGDVLSDPRVNLIVADARNYVLASEQTYDVISSEPSNPWISGVSNLFTKDFFELARSHLAPSGVMVQWLQTYNMSTLDVRTVHRDRLPVKFVIDGIRNVSAAGIPKPRMTLDVPNRRVCQRTIL